MIERNIYLRLELHKNYYKKMCQFRMHYNLRPPGAARVLICFNYDAMPSVKSLDLSIVVL